MTRRRVLAIASAGGHWVQLMRLAPAWDDCDVTIVATNPGLADEVKKLARNRDQKPPKFYAVKDANRWQKFRLFLAFLQIAYVVLRTRPDTIITTGAAPGFFAIWIGSKLGIRTAWIDSIANAQKLSLSGQKAGKHASLWLTQWEHLSKPDGPQCRGSVL